MTSVGVNIAPGWSDTVYGRNPKQMRACLDTLRPRTVRFPWVNNEATISTMRFCAKRKIELLPIIDSSRPPKPQVAEVEATELPICGIEGANEQNTSTAAGLAALDDHQTRLYNAVKGRWPVLSPSPGMGMNTDQVWKLPSDIISAHIYGEVWGGESTPEQAELPDYGKPVWVTETGQFTARRRKALPPFSEWQVDQEEQREKILEFTLMLRANGSEREIIYALMDEGQNFIESFVSEKGWGLYQYDGTPKLVVDSLKALP
jgi:hypothetical protein